MEFIKNLKFGLFGNKFQTENNKNRTTLNRLKELGFSMSNIRKSLLILNNIKEKSLINGTGISRATICRTIQGSQRQTKVQTTIANALNLTISELFPKDNTDCK